MGRILTLIEKHNETRLKSLNLIVSENRLSENASSVLNSDIQCRYAADFYSGTSHAREIIAEVTELTKKVFNADYANISPISGNMCFLGTILSLSKPNDLIGRIPPFFPGGGYPFQIDLFDRKQLPLIFSEENWQIDIEKTLTLLEKHQPPLVILASSIVTYPVPVRQISDAVHAYGGIVAYDGSHTLGLIAGGQFQDPLNQGADLLFGSTHKTFPGPQGGMIVTNNKEIHERLEAYMNLKPLDGPTLICNPHLARIASTGIVLEETQWKEYAHQIVKNSQTIANILHENNIPLLGVNNSDYDELTYCHQVIPNFSMEEGVKLRDRLAENRILTDGFVRIGTSEITRLGFKEKECRKIGEILTCFLTKDEQNIPKMKNEIATLIDSYSSVVL